MPTPLVDETISEERRRAIEQALWEGFTPPGRAGEGRGAALAEAARRLGASDSTLHSWLRTQQRRQARGQSHHHPDWSKYHAVAEPKPGSAPRPRATGHVRRYLLTAAQDETAVHLPFWENLQAFAAWLGAEVRVGGFTYQKGLFEDHATRTAAFASAVQPFMAHEQVDLGGVLFCAEMNTLPTAVRPLSGLETYTRGRWGVFPHAKIQLVSVPAIPGQRAAQVMTTGACTVANYVAKKAGQKAEFHHVIGATLVEIDGEGRIFCRQINATDDGSFQDLDVRVSRGVVSSGHRIEAITWGDIHRPKIDPEVALAAWGLDVEQDEVVRADAMLDALKPRHQFFHDLVDFQPRNHHRRGDHAFAFQMKVQGAESVDAENALCASFLRKTARDWCASVVIASNHNDALPRWLRETDPRADPTNFAFWCRANVAIYEAIERGDSDFDVVRWALARHDPRGLEDIVFVPRTASYVICQAAGGVECSLHGDMGPNGARGTASNLARVAVRMNIGHSHSPCIFDGVYTAGLCGLMDQGYNAGPSSWGHSQIVTYPSGKRTLITMLDGRWRA